MNKKVQVEMSEIQLIALYGMVDAIGVLQPKAAVNLGEELIREGRAAADAAEGNYLLMRQMIMNYIAPKLGEIAARTDEVVINAGYMMASASLTLNVRAAGGVRYYQIDMNGHISEGTGDEQPEESRSAEGDWGGKW